MVGAVISKEKNDAEILGDIKEIIQLKSVELIHLQFVDIEGILKSITVTVDQFDDVIEGKQMFDGSSVKGFSPVNNSDLYLNSRFFNIRRVSLDGRRGVFRSTFPLFSSKPRWNSF